MPLLTGLALGSAVAGRNGGGSYPDRESQISAIPA
jgi:hypothetical protein